MTGTVVNSKKCVANKIKSQNTPAHVQQALKHIYQQPDSRESTYKMVWKDKLFLYEIQKQQSLGKGNKDKTLDFCCLLHFFKGKSYSCVKYMAYYNLNS
jgi:hypothetical protein